MGERNPVFVRLSAVAGNRDLMGNNIPVFSLQDAIKFPDFIHSVKEELDRGFPQAQCAHDTFWDYVSLTPESTHMLMWVMSEPRDSTVAADDGRLRHS